MGGLLLMQLETMQPCSIQAIATAMGRDNSQLTRLIRNLEKVGVLRREQSLFDGREAVLSITESGAAFLTEAKTALIDVVGKILEPLDDCERQQLHVILGKI
ncbi:MAG: MarR family transcriptional regulator [Pseudomonadota bacterium]